MRTIQIVGLVLSSFISTSPVIAQTLQNNYNQSKNQEQYYESIRLRSASEGLVFKCRNLHYNFLDGYVFTFGHTWPDNPPGSYVPRTTYERSNDTISWIWQEGSTSVRGGVVYRTAPLRAEINLTTKTRFYEDGEKIYKDTCISISTNPEVRRRDEIARNPNPGSWQDIGNGISVWRGNDGVGVLGERIRDGDRLRRAYIEDHWDYSYGRRK